MKQKSIIYAFILLVFAVGCSKSVIETEAIQGQTEQGALKAGVIGTTYYVAKTGSDNNAGTNTAPFLTIQKAANVANPGDFVIVKDGVYTGTVTISKSGTSTSRIIIQAENKYGAVMDGGGNVGTGFTFPNTVQYVTISGFTLRNFTSEAIGCHGNTSCYITIEKCKIYDIARINTGTDQGLDGIYLSPQAHHWTITSNLFYNIGRLTTSTNSGGSPYYLNKDHCLYIGTGAGDTYHTFSYNVCLNSSGCQINLSGNYNSFYNNVFAWREGNAAGNGGVSFAGDNDVTNTTIANNIFYQPVGSVALANLGTTGWSIKNNISYQGTLGVSTGGTNYENTNPLVVSAVRANIPNVDFSLQAASPAINKGINVGLTSDFLSNTLSGLPDIGAYEFGGTTTTTPPVVTPPVVTPPVVTPPVVIPPVVTTSPASVGLNTVGGVAEKGDNGYWMATSFTASANTSVSKMNLYVGTASGKARLGIYTNNSGKPGTLLSQTGEITLVNGWNSGALGSSKNLISGTTYFLAIEVSSSATTLYYNDVSGRQVYKSYTYNSFPSSAPTSCQLASSVYSVYAN